MVAWFVSAAAAVDGLVHISWTIILLRDGTAVVGGAVVSSAVVAAAAVSLLVLLPPFLPLPRGRS